MALSPIIQNPMLQHTLDPEITGNMFTKISTVLLEDGGGTDLWLFKEDKTLLRVPLKRYLSNYFNNLMKLALPVHVWWHSHIDWGQKEVTGRWFWLLSKFGLLRLIITFYLSTWMTCGSSIFSQISGTWWNLTEYPRSWETSICGMERWYNSRFKLNKSFSMIWSKTIIVMTFAKKRKTVFDPIIKDKPIDE